MPDLESGRRNVTEIRDSVTRKHQGFPQERGCEKALVGRGG